MFVLHRMWAGICAILCACVCKESLFTGVCARNPKRNYIG